MSKQYDLDLGSGGHGYQVWTTCPITRLPCYEQKCRGGCILDRDPFVVSPIQAAMHRLEKEAQDLKMERELEDRRWRREEISVINKLATAIERLTQKEEHHNKPFFVISTNYKQQNFIYMADFKIVAGTPISGIFTLLDNKTLQPLSGVSFSNQQVAFNSNPEIATFAVVDGKLVGTNVSTTGSGQVKIQTDAAYTDPGDNSQQTGSFSVTKNFTVVASPDGVTFDVLIEV